MDLTSGTHRDEPVPVPAVFVLGDTALSRAAKRLVDRELGDCRVVTPQTFAGDDEVEIEVDEQAKQQGMGPHIDLGEGVVQKHEPGRVGSGARYGGEVGGRSGEERQVTQDLLLAL